jgi:hypothetical protein
MGDLSQERDARQQRRLAYIFHFGWITVAVLLALFMRVWVGPPEFAENLDALEEAETVNVSLDGPLPPTLESLPAPLAASLVSDSVYVPLYRTLYVGKNRAVNKLSATLSIHNTSSEHSLILKKLTYLDSKGEAISELLKKSYALPPMASAEFYIDHGQSDSITAAAAVVEWSSQSPITTPLIEAIVVGKYGAKGFSIHSRGVSMP